MDWDICGPSYGQESNYYMGDGLECRSYIDYWPDVIEENALNEKYCTEVLTKLIQRADNEIEELEGDLFILETQLEWAEKNKYEEWFDICCKGLEENIRRLELSICSLKDESVQNGNANGVQSKTSKEPVKRIHEIIKALLSNDLQDKHEQPADIISKDLRLDEQPADIISKDLRLDTLSVSNSQSDSPTTKVEVIELKFSPDCENTELRFSLKLNVDLPVPLNVQDSGDTATIDTCSLSSSPMLQEEMEKNVIGSPKVESHKHGTPVTDMVLSLVPSFEMQGEGKKNIIKSEIYKVQESSTISDKAVSVRPRQFLNSQPRIARKPKSKIQSDLSGIPKSGAARTENKISFTSSLKSKRTKKQMQNQVEGQDTLLSLSLKLNPDLPVTLNDQDSGVTATIDTCGVDSSRMLQEQMDKIQSVKVEDRAPGTLVTDKAISSIPSLKLQGQARIKSEIFNVQEPSTIAEKAVSICLSPSLNSPRKIENTQKSKIQSDSLGIKKYGAALTKNKISSTSSAKSKGTKKRMQNQVEGQKANRKRANETVPDGLCLNSFLKTREKKKSCTIQKDAVEVKNPCVASTQLLKLPLFTAESTTCTTKDNISNSRYTDHSHNVMKGSLLTITDLKNLTRPKLTDLAKSLGVTGCGEIGKADLIELLAEILIG
ncbi:hypothetical protein BVC80_1549g1 [Macleaya cordata]|uniref:Rho termination factor n=1 Tax=Macleaya cordata TaxID=56857 RepID=A0A200R1K0_MACCD|nr:hypothetical protein BVC80_1549g1 [Macleaya cordata]